MIKHFFLTIKDDHLRHDVLQIVIGITYPSTISISKNQGTFHINNHSQIHSTVIMRSSIIHYITLAVVGLTRAQKQTCGVNLVDVRLAISYSPHPCSKIKSLIMSFAV